MNRRCVRRALLLAVALTGTSPVLAGPLANHPLAFNDGNGPAGGAWTGVGTYSHPFAGGHLEGTIEWAVFGPGQFPFAGLNSWIPVPGQLTYAYQVINTGSDGIIEFSIGGGTNGVSNPGAASLDGANETPFLTSFLDPVIYQFAYYDDIEEQYVGTPVPASTGLSAGLVLSSPRVPNLRSGDVLSEGILRPVIHPIIAAPDGSLHVPPSTPGDYNDDGTVDAADYVVWRYNVNAPAGTLDNDIDGGPIGPEQYNTWRAYFGESAGVGSAAGAAETSVPEPTGIYMTALTILLMASTGVRLRRDARAMRPTSEQRPFSAAVHGALCIATFRKILFLGRGFEKCVCSGFLLLASLLSFWFNPTSQRQNCGR